MNANVAGKPTLRIVKRRLRPVVTQETPSDVVLRSARPDDADMIHNLIERHLNEGHLLPRTKEEIRRHSERFVVAVDDDRVVACGELAPLSRSVAEVRSLVVGPDARSQGTGRRVIQELCRRASAGSFEKLCAFTHSPGYFTHLGFSIVPHVWLPEKISTDCHSCSRFRQCGQYAVVRNIQQPRPNALSVAAAHA